MMCVLLDIYICVRIILPTNRWFIKASLSTPQITQEVLKMASTKMDILVPPVGSGFEITGVAFTVFNCLNIIYQLHITMLFWTNTYIYLVHAGANYQVVTVSVQPGEKVVAEPGAMMYKTTNMKTDVECGSCARCCVGESMCKVIHTNESSEKGCVNNQISLIYFQICLIFVFPSQRHRPHSWFSGESRPRRSVWERRQTNS